MCCEMNNVNASDDETYFPKRVIIYANNEVKRWKQGSIYSNIAEVTRSITILPQVERCKDDIYTK